MNVTELIVLQHRCDRGETFTAEEMEEVLRLAKINYHACLCDHCGGWLDDSDEDPEAVNLLGRY